MGALSVSRCASSLVSLVPWPIFRTLALPLGSSCSRVCRFSKKGSKRPPRPGLFGTPTAPRGASLPRDHTQKHKLTPSQNLRKPSDVETYISSSFFRAASFLLPSSPRARGGSVPAIAGFSHPYSACFTDETALTLPLPVNAVTCRFHAPCSVT